MNISPLKFLLFTPTFRAYCPLLIREENWPRTSGVFFNAISLGYPLCGGIIQAQFPASKKVWLLSWTNSIWHLTVTHWHFGWGRWLTESPSPPTLPASDYERDQDCIKMKVQLHRAFTFKPVTSSIVTHHGIRMYPMFDTWVSLSLLHTGYKDGNFHIQQANHYSYIMNKFIFFT